MILLSDVSCCHIEVFVLGFDVMEVCEGHLGASLCVAVRAGRTWGDMSIGNFTFVSSILYISIIFPVK